MEFNIVLRLNAIDVPLKDLKKSIIEDVSNGVKCFCNKMLTSVLEEVKKTEHFKQSEKENLDQLKVLSKLGANCHGSDLLKAIQLAERQFA